MILNIENLQNNVGVWDSTTQGEVLEILKNQQLRIAKLETINRNYHNIIYTNTDRKMTMEHRFFVVDSDGFVLDNNFDFDAGLQISGNFVDDDEKYAYAQMIAASLNKIVKADRDVEQQKTIDFIEDSESSQVEKIKEIIEEQKHSIVALNACIGGEGSCTTDNLTRFGRL